MADDFKLSFLKEDVVGSEDGPNTTVPDASRILLARNAYSGDADTLILWIKDGTSLVVTVWLYDETSAQWIAISAPSAIPAGSFRYVSTPPSAKLFCQLGANVGNVTTFGAGFTSSSALGSTTDGVPDTLGPGGGLITEGVAASSLEHGRVAITSTSTALPSGSWARGVLLHALVSNPSIIWLGGSSEVAADGSVGGIPLQPGAFMAPPDAWSDPGAVWAVSEQETTLTWLRGL